jgi:formylglycine-generating enzyme required for sulfatase activity
VLLPAVGADGVSEVTVTLLTDDVGVPAGTLAAPVEPEPGAPSPSLVGTWPHAVRVPCSRPPAPDEACVPGGAFWMGNPALRGFLEGTDADRERIVVLSPFFIDRTEVTVESVRAAGLLPTVVWTGEEDGDEVQDWCTYASAPGTRDALPMSCVLWVEAQSYCHLLGRELPTEAQYEYVAGALEARRYPWGSDEPTCTDAVWGRAGFGAFDTYPDRCRPAGTIGLPEPPGWGARDRVQLGDAEVVDLAGNLKEWMLDRWNRQDEPCWSGPGVYRDPVCETASFADGAVRSVRGGAWQFDGTFLSGAIRGRENPNNVYPSVGFRCVRAD